MHTHGLSASSQTALVHSELESPLIWFGIGCEETLQDPCTHLAPFVRCSAVQVRRRSLRTGLRNGVRGLSAAPPGHDGLGRAAGRGTLRRCVADSEGQVARAIAR